MRDKLIIAIVCVLAFSACMAVAQTEKSQAQPLVSRYQPANVDERWCSGNDDMVMDIDGHCHDIDFFIDAYVDANPPKTLAIRQPHLADNCQEDEDWATVHWETPNAVDDIHGVTRLCVNHEELVMEGINELILDGTLIWEWDLP